MSNMSPSRLEDRPVMRQTWWEANLTTDDRWREAHIKPPIFRHQNPIRPPEVPMSTSKLSEQILTTSQHLPYF